MINGQKRNMSEFRKLSAYIMQDDNLQPFLTVQEAMFIAADLKLGLDHHQKSQKIDKILIAMGLDESRYMITGVLSGGQRKRLGIALELINNPPVMFFDEPTSGLDSTSSKQCLTLLKQLAREGRTIICTLHQPSAILFNMLDHLYVIANGNCVYTGSTHNLVPYLNSIGFICPTHYDPVDFLMEICNGDYGPHISKLMELIENGKNNKWRSKTVYLNKSQETFTSQQVATDRKRSHSFEMEFRHTSHYTDNFWRQLCILIKRNTIRLFRDKVLMLTRISVHLTIALIVGTLYFKIGQDAAYVLDNYSLSYYNIMFLTYSAFSATMVTIPLELPILKREHFNRWYKLRSYYLAGKVADFLIQFISTFIYTVIVYYMSGQLPESKRFGLYMLMCLVISLVGQTIGFIIGCSLKIQNSVIFGPFAIMPFVILSGFFVHIKDVNPYFVWLFDISFFKYGFEGILMVIYGYDRAKLKCSADYCHFITPKKFLMELGIEHINYWFNMIILISLCIVLDMVACIILNMKIKKRI
ncbi:ABCG4 protein, partial [Pseudoatta argentina]